jgi:hypothetical protein
LVGVTVKASELPLQVGLVPDVNAMDTAGATAVVTVTEMVFEVAVEGDAQAAFEVITQDTICPFVNDEVVNVGLLVPALEPFTSH